MSKNRNITCPSCGAVFENDLPKCPFCGSTNYEGAEKEYLEELEDIREDLEEIPEHNDENGKKIRSRQILRVAAGFLILLLSIFVVYAVCTTIDENNRQKIKEEIIHEV